MRLETVEKCVRWAAAVGTLLFVAIVYVGIWRGSRRARGRASGPVPRFARALLRGAWYVYVPASIFGAGLLYRLWRPIPLTLSRPLRAALLTLGALLYFPGLALMIWGRRTLGEMYNVATTFGAELYADHRLITSGPYALVRHPMYLGGIMAELGALLIYRTWTTVLAATNIPVLFIRARREEEALAAEFGEQWAEYSRRVPAWIPRLGAR